MPGLVPGIRVLMTVKARNVDGRDKPGHDDEMAARKTAPIPIDKLTSAQAKAELKTLASELAEHDRRYYQDDAPTVSDAAYDALRVRASAIEARFPELVTKDSPSQKIGAAPSGRFAKVQHSVPMLSLGNAFSDDDVSDFVE